VRLFVSEKPRALAWGFLPPTGPVSAGLSFCSGCPVNIPMIVPGVFAIYVSEPAGLELFILARGTRSRGWQLHTPLVTMRAVRLTTTWRPSDLLGLCPALAPAPPQMGGWICAVN
jgi:hypothetical protein